MLKPRRHDRVFLLADVAVHPNDRHARRFPARTLNISKSGAAVFSEHLFRPGEIVGVDLSLPDEGRRRQRFVLYATVRHTTVEAEGNLLGIEFVVGENAGDYDAFERYMNRREAEVALPHRSGFTLVEVCIVMSVICMLVTMAVPIYTRAVEQCRVDVASAKLRAVWSAQRVYWLENRTFTGSLAALDALDLLDSSLIQSQSSPDAVYVYEIVAADQASFTAKALRNGSGSWVGQIQIDEGGDITGQVNGPDGQKVLPAR
ncbi:MAG TPA: PilZ domain-containing protein [Phycisphaerae bacterium]|nr:PilZ domain-containing protein [Phycisphaerae bacterium]